MMTVTIKMDGDDDDDTPSCVQGTSGTGREFPLIAPARQCNAAVALFDSIKTNPLVH